MLILPIPNFTSALATVDDIGSGIEGDTKTNYTGNRRNAWSDLGGDDGNNGLAVMGSRKRTNARLGL